MITNRKETVVFVLFFVVCIVILSANVISSFNYLDLSFLMIFIGCFMRYIYIKIDTKKAL